MNPIEAAKMAVATAASLAGSAMLVRSLADQFLPSELRTIFSSLAKALCSRFTSENTIVIDQMDGLSCNKVYDAVTTYLATKVSTSMRRIRVTSNADDCQNSSKRMRVSIEQGEELIDMFDGAQFKWSFSTREEKRSDDNSYSGRNQNQNSSTKVGVYELSYHKRHKDKVLTLYLPYLHQRAQEINAEDKTLKLYTNENDYWIPVDFQHPATFDTLAMDSELKKAVMDDLARFVKRKDYYKKIGKVWKRGYLLYGPPGTGKSSLVAAMANYLKFDIYDLELTAVTWNQALKKLLLGMGNRSIMVVEDIDCTVNIKDRDQNEKGSDDGRRSEDDDKLTLSGLLNSVDGLWSSCGEERIIVFTTNYKERLDQALLRPGRMDMHVHMGYCGASAFRALASNYHDLDEHPLFGEIEGLLKEAEVTPAEVAEELMKSDIAEIAFRGLIDFINEKETKKKADCVQEE